jgi:hypothetical protein
MPKPAKKLVIITEKILLKKIAISSKNPGQPVIRFWKPAVKAVATCARRDNPAFLTPRRI